MSLLFFNSLSAATRTWSGGGADNNWSTAANWGGFAPGPGDDLEFSGNTRTSPVNDFSADTSFASLTFNNGAAAFIITGNRINLGGSVTNNSANTQTFNCDFVLEATRNFDTVSGDMILGGILSGAGGLNKRGSNGNILRLDSASSTYSGGTTLTQGLLMIYASGGAVSGPIGTGVLTLNPGGNWARIQLNGGVTISNSLVMTTVNTGPGVGALQSIGTGLATWSGNIAINANGNHFSGLSSSLVLSGTITSGGSCTTVSQRYGVVIYSGTGNSWPNLAITGTGRMGAANVLPPSSSVTMAYSSNSGEGGIFDLNGYSQTIGGLVFIYRGGGIVTMGTATLTLNGDVSATWADTSMDNHVNIISGNLNLGGAMRTFNLSDSSLPHDLTISAAISNGGITKTGSGNLLLSGGTVPNLTIIAGNTTLASNNLWVAGNIVNSGNLVANHLDISLAGDWTNRGTFTPGTGSVILNGTTQTVSGNSSFYNFKIQDESNNATSQVVRFESGTTQNIAGTLTLMGLDGDDLVDLSGTNGTWTINFSGASSSVSRLRVRDSNGTGGNAIRASQTINAGLNTGWYFLRGPSLRMGWGSAH